MGQVSFSEQVSETHLWLSRTIFENKAAVIANRILTTSMSVAGIYAFSQLPYRQVTLTVLGAVYLINGFEWGTENGKPVAQPNLRLGLGRFLRDGFSAYQVALWINAPKGALFTQLIRHIPLWAIGGVTIYNILSTPISLKDSRDNDFTIKMQAIANLFSVRFTRAWTNFKGKHYPLEEGYSFTEDFYFEKTIFLSRNLLQSALPCAFYSLPYRKITLPLFAAQNLLKFNQEMLAKERRPSLRIALGHLAQTGLLAYFGFNAIKQPLTKTLNPYFWGLLVNLILVSDFLKPQASANLLTGQWNLAAINFAGKRYDKSGKKQ